jgi:hypothetical protein
MKKVRIGAGSGYAPSKTSEALRLINEGNIQYLCFDQLAELTMSIMSKNQQKDASKGFLTGHIDGMKQILPAAYKKGVKLITNGGGVNPEAAAEYILNIAKENGLNEIKVGIVKGDDISGIISECLDKGWKFTNLETGEDDISKIKDKILIANAYIGADSIVGALAAGADVVVCGRCSDSALFVAPMMHEFGWKYEDKYWPLIGAGITIGHTLECADFLTGVASPVWESVPKPEEIVYPLAEVYEDGTAILEMPSSGGGLLNEWTVKSQLVYEVHDPKNYLMPDGVADMTTVKVEDLGNNRVRLSNMTGKARPDTLKVIIGYQGGFIAETMTLISAPKALTKARRVEEIGWRNLHKYGMKPENVDVQVDYIGVNSILKSIVPIPDEDNINEIGLRVAARGKSPLDAGLIVMSFMDSSPVGWTFSAPSKPRSYISLWPTLIPREAVPTNFTIKRLG